MIDLDIKSSLEQIISEMEQEEIVNIVNSILENYLNEGQEESLFENVEIDIELLDDTFINSGL